MAIGGDFSHAAVEAGTVKGKYAVVPLPGVKPGSIAPAFAGGNNLGVLKSTTHRTLAVDLMKLLAVQEDAGRDVRRDGLPADVHRRAGSRSPRRSRSSSRSSRRSPPARSSCPPRPAWAQIDASLVLPTMFQEVVTGKKDVDAASEDAAKKMNEAFGSAG